MDHAALTGRPVYAESTADRELAAKAVPVNENGTYGHREAIGIGYVRSRLSGATYTRPGPQESRLCCVEFMARTWPQAQSATASPFKWTSAPDKGVAVERGVTLERRNAGKVVAFVLASPPDHVCGSFCVSIPAVQPLDLLPWPSVGEQVSQAHGVGQLHVGFPVLTVGPDPAFSPGPHGVAIGLQPAGDLRPRQARLLLDARQAPGETPGEDGGHSAVMRSLSRHSQFHRPALAA